jgi:hypothetical protein
MDDTQTLKLEAGKYYRTRDGRKAFVTAVAMENPFGAMNELYPVIGYVEGRYASASWTAEGFLLMECERGDDLVAEWVEPKRIQGWMNVYAGHIPGLVNRENLKTDSFGGQIYGSRCHADIAAYTGGLDADLVRIACIEIEVVEGEGLEGGQ